MTGSSLSGMFPHRRLTRVQEARSVFMALPAPAAIIAEDGKVTDVNSEWRAGVASRRDLVKVGAAYGSAWAQPEGGKVVREAVAALLNGAIDRFECEQTITSDEPARVVLIRMRAIAEGRHRLVLVIHDDVSDEHHQQEELLHQATHDPLTGVANRTLLFHRLAEVIERARRFDEQYSLLYVDLDRFKEVNDTYGHVAGDAVLREVTDRWQAEMRATDLLGRVGGDEFVVLMERVAAVDEAVKLADRMRAVLIEPIALGDVYVNISVSVGIATPSSDEPPETAIAEADAQMYRVKRAKVRSRTPQPRPPT